MTSQFQELVGRLIRRWAKHHHVQENYRPDWLKGLELDFYIDAFHTGIEIDGIQHYKFTPAIQSRKDDFHSQVGRDGAKELLCMKNGVRFIRIHPQHDFIHKLQKSLKGWPKKWLRSIEPDVAAGIKEYCNRFGFNAPKRFCYEKVPWEKKRKQKFTFYREGLSSQICARY